MPVRGRLRELLARSLLDAPQRRQAVAPIRTDDTPEDDRNLNAFESERQVPVPCSRVEVAIGYALGLCAFVALRCDSFAYHAERLSKEAARAVRARRQAWQQQPSAETTTSHLEWEGAFVAIALAVVALGYGGLLLTTGREPAKTSAISVATPAVAGFFPATTEATHAAAPPPATAVVAPTPLGPPTDIRLRSSVVTAANLNSILRRSDARSLQRSFDDVRRETLAFHRCGMQMTAADRAVATCDGVASAGGEGNGGGRRVRWTIDFQRTGGRWFIQRVAAR
jgi:hypothetical protein